MNQIRTNQIIFPSDERCDCMIIPLHPTLMECIPPLHLAFPHQVGQQTKLEQAPVFSLFLITSLYQWHTLLFMSTHITNESHNHHRRFNSQRLLENWEQLR